MINKCLERNRLCRTQRRNPWSICVQNGTVHLENNTGTRDQCVSETKFPYYHGIVLLQLSEVDIGCNNGNIGL
jgi:hypothetical protein